MPCNLRKKVLLSVMRASGKWLEAAGRKKTKKENANEHRSGSPSKAKRVIKREL